MGPLFPTKVSDVAQLCCAEILGDSELLIERAVSLDSLEPNTLSFHSNKRMEPKPTRNVALITRREYVKLESGFTYLVVEDPHLAFAKVLEAQNKEHSELWEVSPSARIHPSVEMHEQVSIGDFVVIEARTKIEKGVVIGAHSYLGKDCHIGEETHLYPRVTLVEKVRMGKRTKVFPGAVIGSDGFGFVKDEKGFAKEMPQVGGVFIGDDVRVGAMSTIDRGTLTDTVIASRTKLDDHVHIAHNCQIGSDGFICAQAGIAGSVVIEDQVMIGGQAGIGEHVKIGKGAKLGAQGGTGANLKAGRDYWLTPAIPLVDALRSARMIRRLPEMWKRLKALEETVRNHE